MRSRVSSTLTFFSTFFPPRIAPASIAGGGVIICGGGGGGAASFGNTASCWLFCFLWPVARNHLYFGACA